MNKQDGRKQKRAAALAQLKEGQLMLKSGKKDLMRAQQQIETAQALIDGAAKTLRATWSDRTR